MDIFFNKNYHRSLEMKNFSQRFNNSFRIISFFSTYWFLTLYNKITLTRRLLLVFEDFALVVYSFRVFPARKYFEKNNQAADHTGYLTRNCWMKHPCLLSLKVLAPSLACETFINYVSAVFDIFWSTFWSHNEKL